MFLFWRIALAHVLGDFPLQTDTVYLLKVRFKWGILFHGFVFVILNLLLGWPYLGNKFILIFLISLGILHAVIDKLKIAFKNRYSQGETILTFVSDQALHFIFLSLIIPFKVPPPDAFSSGGFPALYYDDKFIFSSIAYAFASSGGVVFYAAIKNTFSKTIVSVSSIPQLEKIYGFIERLIITFLAAEGSALGAAAVAFSPRLIAPLRKKTGSWGGAIINYFLGLFMGLFLRRMYG